MKASSSVGGAALTLDKVDELIDTIQGTPDLLLMNAKVRRKINTLMRAAGQATETVNDQFGRLINAYGGIPMGVVGDDSEGNAILGFDEDDGSSNLATTSIYAIRFEPATPTGIETDRFIPRIETLSGYGEARDWALDLKEDPVLWRAGTLG